MKKKKESLQCTRLRTKKMVFVKRKGFLKILHNVENLKSVPVPRTFKENNIKAEIGMPIAQAGKRKIIIPETQGHGKV
jgi:hypothetical protein